MIGRREFITLLGGAAAAWPLAARAQQPDRMRRIGVLVPAATDDSEFQARLAAFQQELQRSGWIIGSNMRIDIRWGGGNADRIRKYAAELVELAPDVILAHGSSSVRSLLEATRTVPIVFPIVGDPVGAGFVETLARPGGNVTGFMTTEYSIGGKWLELLKEIAPQPDASGGPSGFNPRLRNQSVCCHTGRGAVAQAGDKPDQHAQCRGDRARRCGLRARHEWRSDRGDGRIGGG